VDVQRFISEGACGLWRVKS